MTTKSIEQTDMFSLFGIEDEYAEQKRREEEEMKKKVAEAQKKAAGTQKTSSSTSNSASSGDKFEVNDLTTIKYFGQELPITDYFTVEELTEGVPTKKKEGEVEIKKVDDEMLRNRMENDFAELVKGMTTMVYIKKKNIVLPILQAKKKGANQGDCIKKEESKDSSFSINRKIPFSLLTEFISISKHFSEVYGTEVHADIYFDLDIGEFFMLIPEQVVHKYWAERIEDGFTTAMKIEERNCGKVMEIHSHHVMSPTPSVQDDESERSPILYAIVGNIDHFFPSISCRTFNKELETHITINPFSVFENPFMNEPSSYDLNVVEVVR